MSEYPSFSLEGRTAMVTASGRGIGRGIALALAHAGADVSLGLRDVDSGAELADEITAMGRRALPVQMDVTKPAEIDAAVAETIGAFGKIDILVNNAGGGMELVAAESVEPDAFDRVVALNLTATFFVSQVVGRTMIERKYGRIINIGSQAGAVALPGESVYCMVKAGVSHLTKCLAVEWGQHGVTVNTVAPTFIETPEQMRCWQTRRSGQTSSSALPRFTGSGRRWTWRVRWSSSPRRRRRSSPGPR